MDCALSQINPVHIIPSYFSKIYLSISCWIIPSHLVVSSLLAFYSTLSPPCPVHLILLDLIFQIIFGGGYKLWSTLSCSILHSLISLALLVAKFTFRTLFSDIFLNVSDQVSHPYQSTVKIIILVCTCVESRREHRTQNWMVQQELLPTILIAPVPLGYDISTAARFTLVLQFFYWAYLLSEFYWAQTLAEKSGPLSRQVRQTRNSYAIFTAALYRKVPVYKIYIRNVDGSAPLVCAFQTVDEKFYWAVLDSE